MTTVIIASPIDILHVIAEAKCNYPAALISATRAKFVLGAKIAKINSDTTSARQAVVSLERMIADNFYTHPIDEPARPEAEQQAEECEAYTWDSDTDSEMDLREMQDRHADWLDEKRTQENARY